MMKIHGAITALVTPFAKDGSVDLEAFDTLLGVQLDAGIQGIVPLGTTGEAPTLEVAEEGEIIKRAVARAKGRIPVIVGTGSNSTASAVQYTATAKELGADACLVVTPYYNRPTSEGLYAHFKAVAEVGLPVLVYNIASRTGRNIETPLLKRIAALPGVVGVKEASGDLNQVMDVVASIKAERPEFAVLSGDDALALPIIAAGGDGLISVLSNLAPKAVVALVKAARENRMDEARRLHYGLLPMIRALFLETNPIPVKEAMNISGFPAGPCRLPLCPMQAETRAKLEKEVRIAISKGDIYVG